MATISKDILSGSTKGEPVALPINTGTFVTVHTGPTNSAHYDEVFLYATNSIGTGEETITVRIGGTGNVNKIKAKVSPGQTVLVLPGIAIKGDSTPVVIDAASTTADKVNVFGFTNKIR